MSRKKTSRGGSGSRQTSSRKQRDLAEELIDSDGVMSRAGSLARDNPVAAGGTVVMALTGCLIIANAVSLQPGRHPAPLFVTRERPALIAQDDRRREPVEQQPRASELVLDMQRALRSIGYYEGPLDGLNGPATQRAIRQYERLQGRAETGRASEQLLALVLFQGTRRSSSITQNSQPGGAGVVTGPLPVPKPSATRERAQTPVAVGEQPTDTARQRRISRIQQLLSDLGYGPLKADGVPGENTSRAIRRFELDRGLPLSGELSASVIDKLEQVSGELLE